GRTGRTTLPQPSWRGRPITHSQVGEPSGERPGRFSISGPPGHAWIAAPCVASASRKSGDRSPAPAGDVPANSAAAAAAHAAAIRCERPNRNMETPKDAALILRTQPRASILARTLGSFPAITKRKHDPSDRSSPVIEATGPDPDFSVFVPAGRGRCDRAPAGDELRRLAHPVVQSVVAGAQRDH